MKIKNIHTVPMHTKFGILRPGDEMIISKEELGAMSKQKQFNQSRIIENYCRMRIRPRPYWIPNLIWKYLLKKMVYLQYFSV